jgi:two-component system nitrate/nitrite response regulator NarL
MNIRKTKLARVLLIDNHAIIRAGLRLLIESRPGLAIVDEAQNHEEATAIATREHPDIVLLHLGGEVSLDIVPELRTTVNEAHIILLTGVHDRAMHHRAVRFGIRGLVMKEQPPEVLLKAIEKVHAGEIWLDRSTMASALFEMTQEHQTKQVDREAEKIATLSDREGEVVALIGEGLKNKQVAERLFISEATVRNHLTSIFSKLGVSDRLELVIYAYRNGLAKPPH